MGPGDSDQEGFRAWVNQILEPRARDRRIRPDVFRRVMDNARFMPEILERQNRQKEFDLPIWDYLDVVVSRERIHAGRAMLRRHRALFNRIEQIFGVEPEAVVATWGLETDYGANRGTVPVVSALATLAYRGRRGAFFAEEIIAALRLVQSNRCVPENMVGSWAGAMGHGQFMPSSVLRWAVDFDGDGVPDLCGEDPTDALASIANYLGKHGWKKGQPWGVAVRLPQGFDCAICGLDHVRPSRDWSAMGVTAADGGPVPDYGSGSILLPAGIRGAAFLVLRNFNAILRYNAAEAYALGAGFLSDRIGGAKAFSGPWPRDDRAMTQGDIGELQFLLTRTGYDTKGIDGLRGPNTTRALRDYQAAHGLPADGYVSAALLERLRGRGTH